MFCGVGQKMCWLGYSTYKFKLKKLTNPVFGQKKEAKP